MAKRKVIDADNSIVEIIDEEDEEYFDIPSMRRINYLKRKRAIKAESENRAFLEEIDEAIAVSQGFKPIWFRERLEIGKLVVLSGRPGERWRNLLQRVIHERCSALMGEILRQDKAEGKIIHKKIQTVVIGREYEAPLPTSHDLVQEFIDGPKKDDEMKKQEKKK